MAGLRRLAALHHVQHDLFQVGLAAGQGDDLRLQRLEVPGRGDLAAVQPGPVPVDPGADLVDVRLGLALLPGEVFLRRVHGHDLVVQCAVPGRDLVGLGDLREGSPAVLQSAQLRIDVGQLEQPLLRLGRCFHGSPR